VDAGSEPPLAPKRPRALNASQNAMRAALLSTVSGYACTESTTP